ncbi:hypothetical protein K438DRAFT_1777853 [Mycena galopus ATCC 62051]|nr:hypothetical protein K438DRAFT_1777853 [Mycena galopus ATCC 62051]
MPSSAITVCTATPLATSTLTLPPLALCMATGTREWLLGIRGLSFLVSYLAFYLQNLNLILQDMARTMRSGAQWSPWEFDYLEDVDVFQSRVSLAPYLAQAIDAANSHEAAAEERADDDTDDDEDAWEDEVLVASRVTMPLSCPLSPVSWSATRSPSPLSELPPSLHGTAPTSPQGLASAPPCPLSSPPSKPYPSPPPTVLLPPSLTARKRHQKTGKKLQRSRACVATAQANTFGPIPKTKHSHAYSEGVAHVLPIKASHLGSSSGGRWEQLSDEYDLVRWDARRPKLILDTEGQIVPVLLGRPEGHDWDSVMSEVQRPMDAAGVTRGPGQKWRLTRRNQRPGNLSHSKMYRRLLQHFVANYSVGWLVGFQSSGLARYLPKLYRHQHDVMKGLLVDQPDLQLPFNYSIFPTVTFNLGPDFVTPEHLDMFNTDHPSSPPGGAARKEKIDGAPGRSRPKSTQVDSRAHFV